MLDESKPIQRLTTKKIIFILAVVLTVSCVTVFQAKLVSNLYFINSPSQQVESVSYYTKNITYTSKFGDNLPNINNSFAPPAKSIYFLETSRTGTLNNREACAVESAVRSHPNWQINLLFLGPVTKNYYDEESYKVLKKYDNINFMELDLEEYAKGTPLETLVRDGKLNKSRWKVSHTSDALRFLTLYKWGGVYLDLDVIVARSFEELVSNWGTRESESDMGSAAMAFSSDKLGRTIAEAAIRDFKNNFRGDLWGHNGPGVMTRILKKICKTEKPTEMNASSCKGFEVYGPELFYPISWQNAKAYFVSDEIPDGDPYAYHIWNKLTEKYNVTNQSAYAKLARRYCPNIYEEFGNQFGS